MKQQKNQTILDNTLIFRNARHLRWWLEHTGIGKALLSDLCEAKKQKAIADVVREKEEARLANRQLVLVVQESDGTIRDIYATKNASVVVRAMLKHDADDAEESLLAEEILTGTLPYAFQKAFGSCGLDGRKAIRYAIPILNQTAAMEESRRNKLAVLGMMRDGSYKEVLTIDAEMQESKHHYEPEGTRQVAHGW